MTRPTLLTLPDGVRRGVLRIAAETLEELEPVAVPVGLHRVRAFVPARRATAGAVPLAQALDRDDGFRRRVADRWRRAHPELADALDRGETPPAARPGDVATGLLLVRPEGWPERMTAALEAWHAERVDQPVAEAAIAADPEPVAEELARASAAAAAAAEQLAAREEELTSLRRELRRARSDADRQRALVRQVQAELVALGAERIDERERAAAALAAAREETARLRSQLELARVDEGRHRDLADSRVRLLLETLVEAAGGLRRELGLHGAQVTPGDVVGAALARPAGSGAPRGGGRVVDDAAAVGDLLGLPRAHLVVDGYNVTKTGFPQLTLAEQRARLVDGLGALAVRYRAEITCCFDGAEPATSGLLARRGVRVLFSAAGLSADELIRRLVRAEPPGRVVLVVSSDQEVIAGVRAVGATAVTSAALVRVLART